MIPSLYYHLVYLIFVTLLSVMTLYKYGFYTQSKLARAETHRFDGSFIIVLVLVLFIGLRNPYSIIFQDTKWYTWFYEHHFGDLYVWNWDVTQGNFLWSNIYYGMAGARIPLVYFYILIAFIYYGCIWWSCRRLFPNDTLTTFVIYLAAFSTYSYSVNGIKAGAAMAFFLMALAMYKGKKILWMILFLFLSHSFHHSMIMPVAAFIVCYFYKNPKVYLAFWFVCFIMAALHITALQELFANIAMDVDEKAVGYLLTEGLGYQKLDFMGGFRLDFILYGFMPILLGWFAVYQKNIKSDVYIFMLNLYTLTNAMWLLCMYASYTNRIAYLSWGLYPIVLVYPLLKEKWGAEQYKIFKWVAYAHLGFTLFMNFIYD